MKMEHEVLAETAGVIGELAVAIGDAVEEGQILMTMIPGGDRAAAAPPAKDDVPARERGDLRAVRERHEIGLDAGRPEAVARRHEHGRRTARENLADLLDE